MLYFDFWHRMKLKYWTWKKCTYIFLIAGLSRRITVKPFVWLNKFLVLTIKLMAKSSDFGLAILIDVGFRPNYYEQQSFSEANLAHVCPAVTNYSQNFTFKYQNICFPSSKSKVWKPSFIKFWLIIIETRYANNCVRGLSIMCYWRIIWSVEDRSMPKCVFSF